jgi:ATP synthase I chain
MTADWYARSLKRMEHAALIIAAAGLIGVLIYAGWRSALGFLCGAIIAHFNFALWKRITGAIGEQGAEARGDSKAVMLGMRYLLIGGAVFVIIKVLDVSVLAVVAGLLVSVAAVLVELVRQLVRPNEI